MGFNLGAFAGGLSDAVVKQQQEADRKRLTDIQEQQAKNQQKLFEQSQKDQEGLLKAQQDAFGVTPTQTAIPAGQQGALTPTSQAAPATTNAADAATPSAIPSGDGNAPVKPQVALQQSAMMNPNAPAPTAAIPAQAQAPAQAPAQSAIPAQAQAQAQTPIQAPTPEMSAAERSERFLKSALANGVSPAVAYKTASDMQQMSLGKLQLNEAEQQADLNKRFKTFTEDHFARLDKINKVDPTSAESVASVLGPEYELLHPGHQIGFDKKTNTITFVGDDGKPIAMKPGEALAMAKKLNDDHFAEGAKRFAKSPTEFVDMTTKIENLKETHAKNQSEATYQDVMGKVAKTNAATSAKIGESTIAYNNARTQTAQIALDLAKNNKAAQEAMRPYQDQLAALTEDEIKAGKGDVIVQKMLVAGATKSADLTKYLAESKQQAKGEWKTVPGAEDLQENSRTGQRRQLDPNTNTWKLQGQGKVSENAAQLGVLSYVDENGQIGYKGADNKYYSKEQEAVESFQNKPAAAKPSAIPTEKAKPAEAPVQSTSALPKDAVKNVGYYLKDKSKPWSAEGVSEHFATQAEAEAAYRKAHVQWHLQNPFAKD